MRFRFLGWSLAGFAAAAGSPPHEGLKIVVRERFPSGTTETTEYVAADRGRTEWRLSSTVLGQPAQEHQSLQIRRCDLAKTLFLNPTDRTYVTASIHARPNAIERAVLALTRRPPASAGAPEVIVETTTVDTGERKTTFGYVARRVVTTRRQITVGSPESAEETRTDGWYIDLETRVSCERAQGRAVLIGFTGRSGAHRHPPRITFKDIGTPENGFAIDTKTTSRVPGPPPLQGPREMVTHRVVTELTRQLLDATLFEIPSGFRSRDNLFEPLAARWHRTTYIIQSVVSSWFR
jgi:hypothetical protein